MGPAQGQSGWAEELARRVEVRRNAEETGAYEPVGRYMGSDELPQELLAQVSELATPKDCGEEIRPSALAKAERIAQEELKVLGWSARDLQGRRKGDLRKVRIAAGLR